MSVTTEPSKICIVGAGVSGLSSALAIYEKLPPDTVNITVFGELFPSDENYPLTSDGAGALWELRTESHREFASSTFRRYETLLATDEGVNAGIPYCSGCEWLNRVNSQRDFLAKDLVHDFRLTTMDELREASERLGTEFFAGWKYTSIIVDSPTYMKFLMNELTKRGCHFVRTRVQSLESLKSSYNIVINCSGLGARTLIPDISVYPIRGQTVVVKAPSITEWQVAESETDLTYILPRRTSGLVVCGGTYEENVNDLLPNIETRKGILERCTKLCPALLSTDIQLDQAVDWVGLRPARIGDVRCEESKDGIIHNYGHAGCGHSLQWGCAERVAQLVYSRFY